MGSAINTYSNNTSIYSNYTSFQDGSVISDAKSKAEVAFTNEVF